MRGLFCYDGPISCDKYGNYYGTVLNNEVFKRYFSVVDSLDVAIRVEDGATQNSKVSQITLEGLNITKIPNIASIGGLRQKKLAIQFLSQSIGNADIVFIRLPSFIGNIAVRLARKMKKPYIIEMVGCPWDSLWNHSFKGKVIAPYMWYLTRTNLKLARYVIYVTNSFLQRRYTTNGKSVNCSNVELPELNADVLKNRIHKILNKEDRIVIGTAAALNVRYKGQQYIIEAISKLKSKGIQCEYQLVGWGDSSYLKKVAAKYGVEDRIKFLGTLPHKEIFSWLDSIDIYAQPSRQEGLPRALIEAMSRGCPVIGAKSGGIPELIDSEFIFSNTNQNIEEICSILSSMSKNVMIRQAKRNYEEAKKYSKAIIEERRNQFFKDFVNNMEKFYKH